LLCNVDEVIRELLHKRFSDVLRHGALLEIERFRLPGCPHCGPASSGSSIGVSCATCGTRRVSARHRRPPG
jgi:tRNA(Ile2) C34 agmatinyltransferase TiaS